MTELQRIAKRFLSHNGVSPQEFAAGAALEILLHQEDRRVMTAIAEVLLSVAPAGGDGW